MSTGPDDVSPVEEQLSAWLDDELPAAELALLTARLMRSPELRARAARYGLIGSTLRDGPPGAGSAGLAALQISARVGAALDGISAPAPAAAPRPATRLLPYAAAAGVALMAVALMPLRPAQESAGIPNARAALQSSIQPAAVMPVRAQSLVVERTGIAGQPYLSPRRLTSYLVYHGEYSGMLSAKLTDSHIVNNRAYGAAIQAVDQPAVR